jgi:hypothetical protein
MIVVLCFRRSMWAKLVRPKEEGCAKAALSERQWLSLPKSSNPDKAVRPGTAVLRLGEHPITAAGVTLYG